TDAVMSTTTLMSSLLVEHGRHLLGDHTLDEPDRVGLGPMPRQPFPKVSHILPKYDARTSASGTDTKLDVAYWPSANTRPPTTAAGRFRHRRRSSAASQTARRGSVRALR